MSPPQTRRSPGRHPRATATSGLQADEARTESTAPTPVRMVPPPYIHATDTVIVTAKSGRTSQVLLIRCPFCPGDTFHLHRAPLGFAQGRRKCPTTHCAYIVISGVLGVVREVA